VYFIAIITRIAGYQGGTCLASVNHVMCGITDECVANRMADDGDKGAEDDSLVRMLAVDLTSISSSSSSGNGLDGGYNEQAMGRQYIHEFILTVILTWTGAFLPLLFW